ncbi:uncharacterized protein G2W53_017902 [Senna tora]|uniref:Uncharacterized protein n=1 Tax=Senna tora TaxID=362788 RepID=A0A834W3J2_9FABA|nr:uncharacterized protein G2W53_040208 [Senna tora]KAF7808070.1 uncharacterized protein G2W53_040231 [Senna tora]KAF7826738.1 uncharacterized protein G2W53_017902 [Senna tora]
MATERIDGTGNTTREKFNSVFTS